MQVGVSATVVDARFCKPLDAELLRRLAKEHPAMISVEEGAIGGFAAHVMQVRTVTFLHCFLFELLLLCACVCKRVLIGAVLSWIFKYSC